ncbi:MAG: hypothetical protein NZ455_13550 [Bacteroidia bacterium]|nr:hypothetical protein [Bacteroidia bacterium]MDW8346588.1 hypothetical protein [Bacteroidia bacterium]
MKEFEKYFSKPLSEMKDGEVQTSTKAIPLFLNNKGATLYDSNLKEITFYYSPVNTYLGYSFKILKHKYSFYFWVTLYKEVGKHKAAFVWAGSVTDQNPNPQPQTPTNPQTDPKNPAYTKESVEKALQEVINLDTKNKEFLQTATFLLIQAEANGKDINQEGSKLNDIAKRVQDRQSYILELQESKNITGIESVDNFIFNSAAWIGKRFSEVKKFFGFSGLGYLQAIARFPRLGSVLSKSWKTIKLIGKVVVVGDLVITLGRWLFGSGGQKGSLEEAKIDQEELKKIIPDIMRKLTPEEQKTVVDIINKKVEEGYEKGKEEGKESKIGEAAKQVTFALLGIAGIIILLKWSKN